MAARLPAPPAGQTYYVWLTQAGEPRLVGELGLNQGFGALIFDADRAGPVYEVRQLCRLYSAILTGWRLDPCRAKHYRSESWRAGA
jgi:hypothetical protein